MRGDERTLNYIEMFRRMRVAMGIVDEPGSCRDCGGSGVIPDSEETQSTAPAVWQICPTCDGNRMGGTA